MPLTQSNKNPGELLRSSDWNELLAETRRLDSEKLSTSGGAVGGNLQVGALAVGTNQFRAPLTVSTGGNVQVFIQNTANNDFARVLLNANGNEWHLGAGGPGVGDAAGALNIYSAASGRNALSLSPSGNVGVGVQKPTAPLHIAGGNWDVTATDGDLKIGNDSYELKVGVALGGGGAGDVRIRASGGTNRLILGAGGSDLLYIREGTGVAMPTTNLSFGAQTRQMISLWNSDYGIGVQSATQYYRSGRDFAWFIGGSHNDGQTDPGGGRVAMSLKNGELTVSGAIMAGNSDIYFTKTDHNHSGFGNNAGYAAIENATNYGALMILGRQMPGVRVVKMWDYLEMNGRALKPGGGAWEALSDERLKRDVEPLSGALDRLLQVRGVSFDWRDPASLPVKHGRQVGVVAQQVEGAFPEWVNTTPDGYKTVEMTGFEALVIEALRELKQQIDAQRPTTGDAHA